MKINNFELSRKKMVNEHLKKRGIENQRVLDVFEEVPRHRFVREGDEHLAYSDYPLAIGDEQTISQPYIVAQMVEALDPSPDDEVLEIGTGSGYQTAILAPLVKKVYTIERIASLQEKAKVILDDLDYENIEYIQKDGKEGYQEEAPYQKIIVSAASQSIPEALVDQLEVGGKMVIPVGGQSLQKLLLLEKRQKGYKEKVLGYCRFVPLL